MRYSFQDRPVSKFGPPIWNCDKSLVARRARSAISDCLVSIGNLPITEPKLGSRCSWCSDNGIHGGMRLSPFCIMFHTNNPVLGLKQAQTFGSRILCRRVHDPVCDAAAAGEPGHIPICLRAAEHRSYRFSSTLPKLLQLSVPWRRSSWRRSLLKSKHSGEGPCAKGQGWL